LTFTLHTLVLMHLKGAIDSEGEDWDCDEVIRARWGEREGRRRCISKTVLVICNDEGAVGRAKEQG